MSTRSCSRGEGLHDIQPKPNAKLQMAVSLWTDIDCPAMKVSPIMRNSESMSCDLALGKVPEMPGLAYFMNYAIVFSHE